MSRPREVYLGIDPGLSKTGYVVAVKGRQGVLTILTANVIKTSPKDTLKERYLHIRSELKGICETYHVTKIVCEAYEVRTYQNAMKSSVAMSKLINEISAEIYDLSIPFLLSSPDIRKNVRPEEIPTAVKEMLLTLPKYKREHILDAYVHLLYQLNRRASNGKG